MTCSSSGRRRSASRRRSRDFADAGLIAMVRRTAVDHSRSRARQSGRLTLWLGLTDVRLFVSAVAGGAVCLLHARAGNRQFGPHEARACEINRIAGMHGEVGNILAYQDTGGGHRARRQEMLSEVEQLKEQLQDCRLDGLGSHLERLMKIQNGVGGREATSDANRPEGASASASSCATSTTSGTSANRPANPSPTRAFACQASAPSPRAR